MGPPSEFLGAPIYPLLVCFTISGVVALIVMEMPNNPLTFVVCLSLAWVTAQIYEFGAGLCLSANWSGLLQRSHELILNGFYFIKLSLVFLLKILCFISICFLATMIVVIIFRGITKG